MKNKPIILVSALIFIGFACSDTKERYMDLTTGLPVDLVKDETTGLMVNASTKQPGYMYVDTKTNDTILGSTGKVINGHIVKLSGYKYVFDEDEKLKIGDDGSIKYKDGDHKLKIEKDGDMKIKDGDSKTKVDRETGERKRKND